MITGRSDATLNRGGVRLGTSEMYSVVEEVDEVLDSLVVHIEEPDELLLFVQLRPGIELDDDLEARLEGALRDSLSPRHAPNTIVAVPAIPRTMTGKKLEVPVKRILTGAKLSDVAASDALVDPRSMDPIAEFARSRGRPSRRPEHLEAEMSNEEVPVLIVGGSLVGLSTAVFLGHHGVPSLVLEHHGGTAIHPRAALVNQRTMENYRAVGLEEEIEEAAAREFVQNGAIVSVDSLGGRSSTGTSASSTKAWSTSARRKRVFITQIGLEPVLLRAAERLGAEIRYASEAASVVQDESGVTVVVRSRDGGPENTVRSRYLVAADGAHSPIRERLGIRAARPRKLLGQHHHLLQGRCAPADGRPQSQRGLRVRTSPTGVLPLLDRSAGRLPRRELDRRRRRDAIGSDRGGHQRGRAASATFARRSAIRSSTWRSRTSSAGRPRRSTPRRLREGRVFLAGDSAHVMPPTGGFGGNNGVQDGYDLAWKLARRPGRPGGRGVARHLRRRTPAGGEPSRPSRRTRATCSASIRPSARTT